MLERTVAERGLSHVRVVGPKYGQELIDLVRHARFSVIPSEWYENCPRSLIESFASGTPVLGANIGGIPEMIDDGVNGLLFTPFSKEELREKIEYLWDRPALVTDLGRMARVKAEREYSTQAHLDRLMAVYDEALGRVRHAATA